MGETKQKVANHEKEIQELKKTNGCVKGSCRPTECVDSCRIPIQDNLACTNRQGDGLVGKQDLVRRQQGYCWDSDGENIMSKKTKKEQIRELQEAIRELHREISLLKSALINAGKENISISTPIIQDDTGTPPLPREPWGTPKIWCGTGDEMVGILAG